MGKIENTFWNFPTFKVELPTGNDERHSLAFFFDPRPDAILEPLELFRKKGQKSLYKAKLAGHKGVKRH